MLLHLLLLTARANPAAAASLDVHTDNAGVYKNRWTLPLLGLVVHCGFFRDITYSTLPPGHGHEGTDASLFAPLQRWLKCHRVATLPELLSQLRNIYSGSSGSLAGDPDPSALAPHGRQRPHRSAKAVQRDTSNAAAAAAPLSHEAHHSHVEGQFQPSAEPGAHAHPAGLHISSRPVPVLIEEIFDLDAFFAGALLHMEGHSTARFFRVQRDADQRVRMTWRRSSTDPWQGEWNGAPGVPIFMANKLSPTLSTIAPTPLPRDEIKAFFDAHSKYLSQADMSWLNTTLRLQRVPSAERQDNDPPSVAVGNAITVQSDERSQKWVRCVALCLADRLVRPHPDPLAFHCAITAGASSASLPRAAFPCFPRAPGLPLSRRCGFVCCATIGCPDGCNRRRSRCCCSLVWRRGGRARQHGQVGRGAAHRSTATKSGCHSDRELPSSPAS